MSGDLLYLVHRIPYPPNKGDKVRSYHLLRHLAASHRVHLGTFVDDPDDEQHLERLRGLCTSVHAPRLHRTAATLRSLAGLPRGEALTLAYYRDAGMAAWVRDTLAAHPIRTAVVFSSSMAQYIEPPTDLRLLVDFVDVDSAKWSEYARSRPWPLSWLYRREGERLLDYERSVAARASRSFFVTDAESQLFRRLAPGAAPLVQALGNGVDAEYFSPDPRRASPFSAGEIPVVFTGAMDYWPNADAVCWFATEVLPMLRAARPALRLHVVGRSPTPAVRALAGPHVVVAGGVPDVRPYLQHAAVVVAPLRLARGIQNKVLEAMAMGRPVVAAKTCVDAMQARDGAEVLSATTPQEYAAHIERLLTEPRSGQLLGDAARRAVLRDYQWPARLAPIDAWLANEQPLEVA